MGWHFTYILQMNVLQITQIHSVTFNLWWIVANVLNHFFNFVLWRKMDNDMLRLLIVFFLGMFCKLVGVLQIRKYEIDTQCNLNYMLQRCLQCLVKVAEANLHLWQPLTLCYKKWHFSYQKYHLTKMTSHNLTELT